MYCSQSSSFLWLWCHICIRSTRLSRVASKHEPVPVLVLVLVFVLVLALILVFVLPKPFFSQPKRSFSIFSVADTRCAVTMQYIYNSITLAVIVWTFLSFDNYLFPFRYLSYFNSTWPPKYRDKSNNTCTQLMQSLTIVIVEYSGRI